MTTLNKTSLVTNIFQVPTIAQPAVSGSKNYREVLLTHIFEKNTKVSHIQMHVQRKNMCILEFRYYNHQNLFQSIWHTTSKTVINLIITNTINTIPRTDSNRPHIGHTIFVCVLSCNLVPPCKGIYYPLFWSVSSDHEKDEHADNLLSDEITGFSFNCKKMDLSGNRH